jgi:hypothetical protein
LYRFLAGWVDQGWQYQTITIWGGSNNIFNRLLHDNVQAGLVYMYADSNNNIIQNELRVEAQNNSEAIPPVIPQ